MKYLAYLVFFLLMGKVNAQVDEKALKQKMAEEPYSSEFDSIAQAMGYRDGDKILVWTIFTISKAGKLVDIKARGPHPILEKEAIRILENTPEIVPENFKPKEVDPKFSLPITFVIETERQETKRLKREIRKSKSENQPD